MDLAGRYSNGDDLHKLEAARASIEIQSAATVSRRRKRPSRAKNKTRTPQRLERRLPPATIDELIQAYRDGTSTAALAQRYRVSKTAVLDLLTRRHIPRRYQPMTDTDITHAEQLYLTGHSLTACATLTGFPASSINRALHKRGTPMRPASRPRSTTR